MHLSRYRGIALLTGLVAVASCAAGFRVSQYPTQESLYSAGVQQLRARKWDNAVAVFEKLTLELPARDTLLPMAHYHLARAYSGRGEHLLSAQTYQRLSESFATDTLADDALYLAGRELQRLWRRPMLDALYGGEAAAVYQTMLSLYPDSEWGDSATAQLRLLDEWFATKDYESAMHYFRRKAYDSAIIYLRDVVTKYASTAKVRDAYLRLAESFEAIRYREDKAEVCATLRERWPSDREVITICGVQPPAKADSAGRDTR